MAIGKLNPAAGGSGCTNPSRSEGTVVYNWDFHVLQYCDGDDWWAAHGFDTSGGGGCTAPVSCSNVGEVCSDGSIFAGFMVYNNSSCEPLYVTDDNQSTSSQWKTATGTNDITDPADKVDAADEVDAVDGQYNRDNRGGGTFPAFELCEDNTYHGKTDWYLPARTELNLLWLNRAAINANATGNFTTSAYWSSTEDNTSNAWPQGFIIGDQDFHIKTAGWAVRCVRREGGGDETPDAFNFTDQTNVTTSTLTVSNSVTITGITGNVNVSVTGDGSPQVRINGGAWVTIGTIQNGQSLEVRLTSNAANSTMNSATVTVGTVSDQWDVTTESGGPTGCPNIGDLCSDGSIFAGDTNMYVTDVNQSTGIQWKATTGNDDINPGSLTDGAVNHANVTVAMSTLPAMNLCDTLDRHGRQDWVLPSRDELSVLNTNRLAIDASAAENFMLENYWSSSEDNTINAWVVEFGETPTNQRKTNQLHHYVRCVRRQ